MGRWKNIGIGTGTLVFEDHLLYIGRDRILRWRSDSGQYWIHVVDKNTNWGKKDFSVDPEQQNWCDPLLTIERQGFLYKDAQGCPSKLDKDYRIVYLGPDSDTPKNIFHYILVWNRATGEFRIYMVGPENKLGLHVPGTRDWTGFALVNEGTWDGRKWLSDKEMVYIGRSDGRSFVLDWDDSNRRYRVWWCDTQAPKNADPLSDIQGNKMKEEAAGVLGTVSPDVRLVGLTDRKQLLALEPWSGRIRTYRWIASGGHPWAGLGPVGPDARVSSFQDETRVLYIGNENLLSWDRRSGRYSIRGLISWG